MPDTITTATRLTRLETQMIGVQDTAKDTQATVIRIESKINGRPSWAVTTYITVCTALTASAVTALVAILSNK